MYVRKSKIFLLVKQDRNLLLFQRPYIGKTRKEIREQILAKQIQIKRTEIPEGWSLEAADFINKVLNLKKYFHEIVLANSKKTNKSSWT